MAAAAAAAAEEEAAALLEELLGQERAAFAARDAKALTVLRAKDARIAELEQEAAQLAAWKQQASRDLESQREANVRLTDTLHQYEEQQDALHAEMERVRQEAARIGTLTAQLEAEREARVAVRREADQARGELLRLRPELAARDTELSELRARVRQLETLQHQAQQAQLAGEQQLAARERDVEVLKKRLEDERRKHEWTTKRLSTQLNEAEAARQVADDTLASSLAAAAAGSSPSSSSLATSIPAGVGSSQEAGRTASQRLHVLENTLQQQATTMWREIKAAVAASEHQIRELGKQLVQRDLHKEQADVQLRDLTHVHETTTAALDHLQTQHQQRMSEARAAADACSQELRTAMAAQRTAQHELVVLRRQYDEQRARLAALEGALDAVQRGGGDASQVLAVQQTRRVDTLSAELQTLQGLLKGIQAQREQDHLALHTARADVEQLTGQLADARADACAKEHTLAQLRARVRDAELDAMQARDAALHARELGDVGVLAEQGDADQQAEESTSDALDRAGEAIVALRREHSQAMHAMAVAVAGGADALSWERTALSQRCDALVTNVVRIARHAVAQQRRAARIQAAREDAATRNAAVHAQHVAQLQQQARKQSQALVQAGEAAATARALATARAREIQRLRRQLQQAEAAAAATPAGSASTALQDQHRVEAAVEARVREVWSQQQETLAQFVSQDIVSVIVDAGQQDAMVKLGHTLHALRVSEVDLQARVHRLLGELETCQADLAAARAAVASLSDSQRTCATCAVRASGSDDAEHLEQQVWQQLARARADAAWHAERCSAAEATAKQRAILLDEQAAELQACRQACDQVVPAMSSLLTVSLELPPHQQQQPQPQPAIDEATRKYIASCEDQVADLRDRLSQLMRRSAARHRSTTPPPRHPSENRTSSPSPTKPTRRRSSVSPSKPMRRRSSVSPSKTARLRRSSAASSRRSSLSPSKKSRRASSVSVSPAKRRVSIAAAPASAASHWIPPPGRASSSTASWLDKLVTSDDDNDRNAGSGGVGSGDEAAGVAPRRMRRQSRHGHLRDQEDDNEGDDEAELERTALQQAVSLLRDQIAALRQRMAECVESGVIAASGDADTVALLAERDARISALEAAVRKREVPDQASKSMQHQQHALQQQQRVDALTSELTASQATCSSLQQRVETLESELARCRDQATGEAHVVAAARADLTQQLDSARATAAEHEQRLAHVSQTLAEREAALSQAQGTIAIKTKLVAELRDKLRGVTAERDELTHVQSEQEERIRTLRRDISAKEKLVAALRQQLDARRGGEQDQSQRVGELESQLHTVRQQHLRKDNLIRDLRSKLTETELRLAELAARAAVQDSADDTTAEMVSVSTSIASEKKKEAEAEALDRDATMSPQSKGNSERSDVAAAPAASTTTLPRRASQRDIQAARLAARLSAAKAKIESLQHETDGKAETETRLARTQKQLAAHRAAFERLRRILLDVLANDVALTAAGAAVARAAQAAGDGARGDGGDGDGDSNREAASSSEATLRGIQAAMGLSDSEFSGIMASTGEAITAAEQTLWANPSTAHPDYSTVQQLLQRPDHLDEERVRNAVDRIMAPLRAMVTSTLEHVRQASAMSASASASTAAAADMSARVSDLEQRLLFEQTESQMRTAMYESKITALETRLLESSLDPLDSSLPY